MAVSADIDQTDAPRRTSSIDRTPVRTKPRTAAHLTLLSVRFIGQTQRGIALT